MMTEEDIARGEWKPLRFDAIHNVSNSLRSRNWVTPTPEHTLPQGLDLNALLAAAGVEGELAPSSAENLPEGQEAQGDAADFAEGLMADGDLQAGEVEGDVSFDEATPADLVVEPSPEPVPQWPTAAELEHIHQEAFQTGYQAGYNEGLSGGSVQGHVEAKEAATIEFNQQISRMIAVAAAFTDAVTDLESRLAPAVLKLAIHVAETLVQAQLKVDAKAVLPLIEQALASIPPEVTQASVRLNPADLATVRLFLNTESPAIQWQCIEDHNVAAGGCVIDTPSAHIDMTGASRWKALLATLGAESHGRA